MADKFDEMAQIAGKAGGLDEAQWSGLAHILRSVARDAIKECDNAMVETAMDDRSRRAARKAIKALLASLGSLGDRSDEPESDPAHMNQI
ncbi:hypothetical protein [Hyphomicrobium sp. ghe19]|uniref:hypothetical protein n=1 Tax=Hyphomicrobium sp. ghe19 TaxID=2682968 RepID=UPI001366C02D|nr:hypothetical protein HYPP_01474 [Hyphomicrobium sp. ghe19]